METKKTPKPFSPQHYFEALLERYGEQYGWLAKTRQEMMIGAVLTQNTAWTNVEKAPANLRAAGSLNFAELRKELLSWKGAAFHHLLRRGLQIAPADFPRDDEFASGTS
jgi:endonuclease III-like uncharacterized protein